MLKYNRVIAMNKPDYGEYYGTEGKRLVDLIEDEVHESEDTEMTKEDILKELNRKFDPNDNEIPY